MHARTTSTPTSREVAAPGPAGTFAPAPPVVARTLQAPGRPLEPRVRREMEGRVGFDLSQVRVHAGADAATSAASVGARAYTVGSHVVFGRGHFAPATETGSALLAHELVHTRQQRGADGRGEVLVPWGRSPDGTDPAEREAHAVAGEARPAVRHRVPVGRVQRLALWESIKRLFGHGTFPDGELQDYLTRLDRQGEIEGGLFSDDRAREVVRRWQQGEANYTLTPRLMSLLVREMLDGWTLEEDERAIIALLRGAGDDALARIVREAGEPRLRDKIDDDDRRRQLDTLLEQHRSRLARGEARRTPGTQRETPTSDRLLEYLRELDRRDAPVGAPDSRRLAREVVDRWQGGDGRFFLPARRKILLLRELIAAAPTPEQQEAVLGLVRGAGDAELRVVFDTVPEASLRAALQDERRGTFDTHVDAWRDRAGAPGADGAGFIERVVVDQEISQSVTAHYRGGATFTDIASTGKGHCAVDEHGALGAASTEAGSRVDGSNLTPVGMRPVSRKLRREGSGVDFWTEFHTPRSVALHRYSRVDGTPLSHGCVRLHEATAERIFEGARSLQDVQAGRANKATEVEVRGLARPRINWPALQAEWANDLAGAQVQDGEPVSDEVRRQVRRQRRTFREIYDVDDDELDRRIDALRAELGGDLPSVYSVWGTRERRREALPALGRVRDLIPRCTDLETVEERRLGAPGQQALAVPAQLRQLSDGFAAALATTRRPAQAEQVVRDHATRLWAEATAAAQAEGSNVDDRPLYWTRLRMLSTLRTWEPRWTGQRLGGERMTPDDIRRQRGSLLLLFERASRGLESAAFQTPDDVKRILVSGFDPFQLEHGLGRSNPSGAAALALDGQTVQAGGVEAHVEAVVFPVRFPDFDAGVIESFFRPHLVAERPPDMIMTLSMGVSPDVEVERFAGRRRSATATGNLDRPGGGGPMEPAVPPGLGPGPEFLRATLPEQAIRRGLGRDRPLPAETEISEIRPGETRPVTTTAGPTAGSTAVRGSGGGYLSNEISYRTLLLRRATGAQIPVGHVHTPYLGAGADDATRRAIVQRVRTALEAALPEL